MNILHVMYLYNQLKDDQTWIWFQEPLSSVQKAATGYRHIKLTIKLIDSGSRCDPGNDKSIGGKIEVVFIEDYRVSNAEMRLCGSGCERRVSDQQRRLPVPAT